MKTAPTLSAGPRTARFPLRYRFMAFAGALLLGSVLATALALESHFSATLRESIEANTVHGSDSLENAAREIAYFFAETELCPR